MADDFTGLQAVTAAFHAYGLSAETVIGQLSRDGCRGEFDVIGLDTTTRLLPSHDAARRVEEAVAELLALGVGFILKQNDSTLRGNVGAELAALVRASAQSPIVYCPSCPSAGRTVQGGSLLLADGTADGADMPRSLGRLADQPGLEGLRVVSAVAPQDMSAALASAEADRTDLIIADASSEEDLEAIVDALLVRPPRTVAGCVGIAHHIARRIARSRTRAPLLFVVGSLKERNRRQVEVLQTWNPCLHTVRLDLDELLAVPEPAAQYAIRVACMEIVAALQQATDVIYILDGRDRGKEGENGRGDEVVGIVERIAKTVLNDPTVKIGGLCVVGGMTADRVLQAGLGASRFRLVQRLYDGGTALVALDGRLPGLPVVTKSGGWGQAQGLVVAERALLSGAPASDFKRICDEHLL